MTRIIKPEIVSREPFDIYWPDTISSATPTFVMDYSTRFTRPFSIYMAQRIMNDLLQPAEPTTFFAAYGDYHEGVFTRTVLGDTALQVLSLGDKSWDRATAQCIHEAMLEEDSCRMAIDGTLSITQESLKILMFSVREGMLQLARTPEQAERIINITPEDFF